MIHQKKGLDLLFNLSYQTLSSLCHYMHNAQQVAAKKFERKKLRRNILLSAVRKRLKADHNAVNFIFHQLHGHPHSTTTQCVLGKHGKAFKQNNLLLMNKRACTESSKSIPRYGTIVVVLVATTTYILLTKILFNIYRHPLSIP